MGLIISIVVGILAGFIAEKVMNSNGGMWTNLFVGILGGILGGMVVSLLGLSYIGEGFVDRVVVSTCGAVLLLAIWRAIKGTKPA
ncbi:GlsB/YeaQ/YmgE family stress response membrane protein [Xanthobacter sp. AM11]|uniref:GlsB/YeaQ/YmgE family stress response membrane protein n=1 Tax=Xanthobacter sp. AM11 TaxID=3380643 RepID=UPI0039BF3A04